MPISQLRPGDKVLATNTRTGKTRAESVTTVWVHHDGNRYDLTVKTAHGTAVIHTTTTHLFWDLGTRRWVKAAALRYGTHLATPGGTTATVTGGHNAHTRTGWMWDLTIPTDHDFYITFNSTAALVHNCAAASDAQILSRNMQEAGISKPAGTVAHHIVPGGARVTAASKALIRSYYR